VALCEAFERAFGRPARFSFRRHGDGLSRALARIDRYWHGGTPGAGVEQVSSLIAATAQEAQFALASAVNPQSLAYFIPLADEVSKDRRRWWKRRGNRRVVERKTDDESSK
jgi:hypothetical protein